ncbi:MAG: SMP-30/gluconolactonase/LRE family protein, partial [Algicola sp.]|nr:SMP-30/gluconolactonase/LRE family protein [Algicola sp.]
MVRHLVVMLLPLLLTLATGVYAGNRFERFTVDQGLSQNTVTSMLQDSQGFLWFGTQNGLNRFDGYEFLVFHHNTDDPNSLSSSFILSLLEDEQGYLWIGTFNGGLNRFDPRTAQFKRFKQDKNDPNSLKGSQISALYQSSDGTLLIGTHGDGLSVYNRTENSFEQFVVDVDDPASISHNDIWSITQDSQNRIWIGTTLGFNLFSQNQGTFSRFLNDPVQINSLSDNRVLTICPDGAGNLWIGTSGGGLNYFEPDTGRFSIYRHDEYVPTSLSHDRVRNILTDNDGQLWVATYGGLDRLVANTGQFIHFDHDKEDKNSINGNIIQTLLLSKDNILWVGLYATGLAKYNPQQEKFSHYKQNSKVANSLSGNEVWAFTQDANGTLWLGTDGGGLNRYDAEQHAFIAYHHDPDNPRSISNNRVYAIAFDRKNTLWSANFDGGVNRFDLSSKTFKRYRSDPDNENSLNSDHTLTVFVDSKDRVWIGTYRGLHLYNPRTDDFTRFLHQPDNPNSLSHNAVLSVKEDSKGNLWIGTYGGGLNRLDTQQRFTRYRNDVNNTYSLSNEIVTSTLEDQQGDIWVTTYGGGLNKLDVETGRFTHFGLKDGLASNSLNSLLQDDAGNLWISTSIGLSEFNLSSQQFINYTELDGLPPGEFISGSAYQSAQGEMFFGGSNGFIRFYPQNIKRPVFDMPVQLTQMRVTNVAISVSDQNHHGIPYLTNTINHTSAISLSYLDDLFSFEFAALGFARTSQTRYAYKLKNWDENWINTDFKLRRATYTNIPAGSYTLKVRAKGLDGKWGQSIAQLKITISPPPWRTWWAYIGYIIIVGSIIGAIMWQRHQKFRQVRASEKRLSLALWSSGNELWDWDLQTNMVFRSRNIKTLHGEDGFELFNAQTLRAQVHADDFEQLWAAIESHKNNQSKFIDATYRVKNKQGQWRWVRNRAKTVERSAIGQALRIVGTVDNIQVLKQAQSGLQALNLELENRVTERTFELTTAFNSLKQTQQELVESKKLAALGSLVVGIAHELNTPLGIIVTAATKLESSFSTLCEQTNAKTLTLSKFKQFETISKDGYVLLLNNLQRTSCLIHDFKALAMETASETGLPVDLLTLLDDIKKTRQQRFDDDQICMKVMCAEHITLVSHLDVIHKVIEQLIDNSIVHAFDAVTDRRLTINVSQSNQSVTLEYSDNGCGL